MAFDIEVVFAGLIFVCTPGFDDCPYVRDSAGRNVPISTAYLVNASRDREVCTYPMPGNHRPRLRLEKDQIRSATGGSDCRDSPTKHCRSLKDIELCVVLEDSQGRVIEPAEPRLRHRGNRKDRHPKMGSADYHNYRWLAGITAVEPRAENLCWDEMNARPGRDGLVIGKVRIDRGILSTNDLKRHPERGLMRPYVLWDLTRPTAPQEEFPRALPAQVRWRIPDIRDDWSVTLWNCVTNQRLYTLTSGGRDIRIEVSNLPRESLDVTGERILTHFRWFYQLVDWVPHDQYSCELARDLCPADATLPKMPSRVDPALALHLVTSESVHCPPAGSK